MNAPAFNLAEEINNRRVEYILHGNLWDAYKDPRINLGFSHWKKVKYLNEAGTGLNLGVNRIPDDKGGIYLFFVQCNIISGITNFPLYIGRAQYTRGQNLRKRIKEYFQKYAANNERPKIYRMINYWKKDLYVAYYPLISNPKIIAVERGLINSLLLPMNDLIPNQKIRKAIKAFS